MARWLRLILTVLAAAQVVTGQVPRAAGITQQPVPSPEQIAFLEQAVAKNPDDIAVRTTMLKAYEAAAPVATDAYRAARLRHIEYVIEANPASDLAAAQISWVGSGGSPYANASDHQAVRDLWLREAGQHFEDTPVVLNALRFLAVEEKKDAEEVFLRVIAARPAERQVASYLGFFYASGLMKADTFDGRVVAALSDSQRASWEAHCREQLEATLNARVLMGAATALPNIAMRRTGGGTEFEAMVKYSEQLRSRAVKADEAAGQPKGFPAEQQMFSDETKRSAEQTGLQAAGVPFTPNQVNVAANVESAKVLLAPPPVYPPVAMQGHVQGTVRMQVVIGQDGLVRSVQLIRGHPLLAQAAVDAVKTWKYEPTMLNGTAVSVVTTVDVPFTLPPE